MAFEASGAAGVLGGEDGGAAAGGEGGGAAAAGGDGGAAAGAAQGGGEGGGEPGGGGDPDWYAGLSADTIEGETASNRDWVKAKGFKDVDGLIKSARDTEKALRDSGRIKVPGEGASDEEIATWRKGIGVPDTPEGYEVKLPENAEGLELDAGFLDVLRAQAHKAGAPKGAFEAIAGAYVEKVVADHIAAVQAQDAERDAKFREWGALKDEKIADCNAAVRALGFSRSDIAGLQAALGSGKVFDMLAKIGGGMAEDTLVQGGRQRFTMSRAEVQGEINRMRGDPEIAGKIMETGTPERAKYDRLVDELGRMVEAEKQS